MNAPTWLDIALGWHACGEIVLPIVFPRKKSAKSGTRFHWRTARIGRPGG